MKFKSFVWWLLLMVILMALYSRVALNLPQGVHSWAQADRYALACMYFDDTRFFHAATYNLMSDEGRVGVEFPALPYVSALLAKITDRSFLPLIMKGLNFILLMFSLIFLAKQTKGSELQRNGLISLLFLSPVLVYYGFNFLPDTTGLSFILFAFGYVLRFADQPYKNDWLPAVLIAGVASAIKTTCGIYFIAISAGFFLHFLLNKQYKKLILLSLFAALITGAVVAYDYLYFFSINKQYWSIIFMSESQPITNLADLNAVWKAFKFWGGQWITWPQAVVGLFLLIVGFMHAKHVTQKENRILTFVISLSTLGVVAFVLLMGKQFVNHDYYFISAILPLLFLAMIAAHNRISYNLPKHLQVVYTVLLAASLLISGLSSFAQFETRTSSHFFWKNREILNDNSWMVNGDQRLTDLGIAKTAKIFVLYEFAPNTPLVYFNRRGKVFNHEEMTREWQNLSYWLDRIKPDYIILNSQWEAELNRRQVEFCAKLKPYKRDGNLVIFTYQISSSQ